MNVELVINAHNEEVDIAVLEDKVLSELHKQKSDSSFSVGDIYLGKVRNVVPSPSHGFHNLLGHVWNGDGFFGRAWAQGVVDDHNAGAHLVQGWCHK